MKSLSGLDPASRPAADAASVEGDFAGRLTYPMAIDKPVIAAPAGDGLAGAPRHRRPSRTPYGAGSVAQPIGGPVTTRRPRSVRRRLALAGLGLLGVGVLAFGLAAPPERCPDVTAAELQASATEAADWFARNQEADGTWLYQYDAEADEVVDDYNVVRHAGGIMGLYQAAAAGVPGALESADRGFEWAEDRLVERDGWAALSHRGRTATGATALLVAGLVERREATGDDVHDELLGELGRFLAARPGPGAVGPDHRRPARDRPPDRGPAPAAGTAARRTARRTGRPRAGESGAGRATAAP